MVGIPEADIACDDHRARKNKRKQKNPKSAFSDASQLIIWLRHGFGMYQPGNRSAESINTTQAS